jgi:hypothetical protein
MNPKRESLFGDDEPIFVYTQEQAVEDGLLVPLSRFPGFLLTSSIMADASQEARKRFDLSASEEPTKEQLHAVIVPFMMDALLLLQASSRSAHSAGVDFVVFPLVLEHTFCGTVWIVAENKKMVLMKPSDY